MEHLLLKAATTATDQGTFEAVISTATPDREGDVVEPAAIAGALAKWAALGKLVPLAYRHTEEVIGHIDPATVRVEGAEVLAKGWIDQSIPRGEETWRLVKSGTLSFSYGYLIPKGGSTKRAGGGRHIRELDVFEISVVPVLPANNDTRVLSFKALAQDGVTDADVQAALAGDASNLSQDVKDRLAAMAQRIIDNTKSATPVDQTDAEEPGEARSGDSLRKESRRLELAVAGVTPSASKSSGHYPWDDLRRESYRLMADVLSG